MLTYEVLMHSITHRYLVFLSHMDLIQCSTEALNRGVSVLEVVAVFVSESPAHLSGSFPFYL